MSAEILFSGSPTNTSIVQFESRNTEVATPKGTPSPPIVTSTVARTVLTRRKFTGPFERFELDECSEIENEDLEVSIGKEKKVKFSNERSSLGLLNPDSLANFTFACTAVTQMNSFPGLHETEASFQFQPPQSPPTIEAAEEQAAAEFDRLRLSFTSQNEDTNCRVSEYSNGLAILPSTDNSAETVIHKNGSKISEKSSFQSSPSDDTVSTVHCALPPQYLVPTPHMDSTDIHMNYGISYFLDSTCDTRQDVDSSGRNEFPSGVQPMTPYWEMKNRENVFNPLQPLEESECEKTEINSQTNTNPGIDHLRNISIGAKSDAFINVSFGNFPSQNFEINPEEGNFVTLSNDQFKEFMDAEEKENAREFQFIQDEEMPSGSSSQSQVFSSSQASSNLRGSRSFDNLKSQSSQETVSWSDYFREGTSKIGCSLEHTSGSAHHIQRPDFGLTILKSPTHRPIKVFEGTDTEDSVERSERKSISEAKNSESEETTESTLNQPAQLLDGNLKNCPEVDPEFIVSFLEDTVCKTLADKSILDPSLITLQLVAEIIGQTTNGLYAREYAEQVLKAIRAKGSSKNCDNVPSSSDSLASFLPSFINDTFCATPVPPFLENSRPIRNASTASKDLNRSNMRSFIVRHSSPKKSQNESVNHSSKLAVSLARTNLFKKLDEKNNSRVRRPLGEITHMHVPQNLEESLIMECEESFPFLSDHSSLLWMNCITTQTRVFKLKNASKNCQILRVIIIGEKFSIGESGITSLEMKFQPEEVKKVKILFDPSNHLGWTLGAVKLKSQSMDQKCFKAKIPLQAHSGHPGIIFQSSSFSLDVRGRKVFKITENRTATIDVINVGKTSGFVLFPKVSENLVISPSRFVLNPGACKTVQITSKSDVFKHHFAVLHGSEATRMLFKLVTRSFLENRELLEDFTNERDDEIDGCNVSVIKPNNVKPFYSTVESFKFEIIVDNHGDLSGSLSAAETRFFTVEDDQSRTFQNSQRDTPKENKSYRGEIYLEKSSVEMSVLNWQSSTIAKVVIINRTKFAQVFRIVAPRAPFFIKFHEVTVKPRYYLSVPISFKPKSVDPDYYEAVLSFENISTKALLTCKLSGKVLL